MMTHPTDGGNAMIIATAGHVDHGKTSLIHALTGVDTDRLPDEKRRGLTIDIGFAYADLGAAQLAAFVDVPGHDRFVRNMLAGVCAIDLALLVVAADDGPMPQTLEHLAIVDLLGAKALTVVITRVDRVEADALAQARLVIRTLLAGTRFAEAPMFETCAPRGQGIAELRAHLAQRQASLTAAPASGHFRLAVDRGFTVPGTGLVVTGVALSGEVRVGDALTVSPSGQPVRVRGIHAHNRSADMARAGQRCALAIAGLSGSHPPLQRGQWLVAPAIHQPTQRFDALVRWLTPSALKPGQLIQAQLHVGAAALPARLVVLTPGDTPADETVVQVQVFQPVAVLRDDRFVLRDPAARQTLGGGRVLDPFAPSRGRARASRRLMLEAMADPDPQQALARCFDQADAGLDLAMAAKVWNLTEAELARWQDTKALVIISHPPLRIGITSDGWQRWRTSITQALGAHHLAHADEIGLIEPTLILQATDLVAAHTPETSGTRSERLQASQRQLNALASAAIRQLADEDIVIREGVRLRMRHHAPQLAPQDGAMLLRIVSLLEQAGLRAPIAGELAQALELQREEVLVFLRRMAGLGHLLPVAPNRFYLPQTVQALATLAKELSLASDDGYFDAARYRDASGIGRNLTIEVLEYLDRVGYTRFAGNRRRWIG